jgi:hypothetical protein
MATQCGRNCGGNLGFPAATIPTTGGIRRHFCKRRALESAASAASGRNYMAAELRFPPLFRPHGRAAATRRAADRMWRLRLGPMGPVVGTATSYLLDKCSAAHLLRQQLRCAATSGGGTIVSAYELRRQLCCPAVPADTILNHAVTKKQS